MKIVALVEICCQFSDLWQHVVLIRTRREQAGTPTGHAQKPNRAHKGHVQHTVTCSANLKKDAYTALCSTQKVSTNSSAHTICLRLYPDSNFEERFSFLGDFSSPRQLFTRTQIPACVCVRGVMMRACVGVHAYRSCVCVSVMRACCFRSHRLNFRSSGIFNHNS
jgi:hypothetical protein